MPVYSIPDPETLHREIQASHERCRKFGVNPNDTRNLRQNRLTDEELAVRLEQNREFLEIATAQIGELYQFVSGAGFAVNIADNEGYILHIIGDKPVLEELPLSLRFQSPILPIRDPFPKSEAKSRNPLTPRPAAVSRHVACRSWTSAGVPNHR
jgi:hypothetical protein